MFSRRVSSFSSISDTRLGTCKHGDKSEMKSYFCLSNYSTKVQTLVVINWLKTSYSFLAVGIKTSRRIFWFPMLLKKIFWFWWRKKKIWFRVFVILEKKIRDKKNKGSNSRVVRRKNFWAKQKPYPPPLQVKW